MGDNNVHTSVVIELSNKEEPEDQKTYQIDIEDVEIPKDYVIDQIFCGENVTVYALFEVPEGYKTSDKNIVEMSNSNMPGNYKFFHKNSYKKITNEKKKNGFKHNSSVVHSDEDINFFSNKDRGNGSLYCLKHLGGNYEMLTPEKKDSDLKVLYSKEVVPKSSKSTKFKSVSKGVNTDIVQSPKIIEEVQRAVGLNIPITKKEKNDEVSSSSFSKSSYEVIEMEMGQSYSSLSSDSFNGKYSKKSVPKFFLVPFLMMEDGIMSHNEKADKNENPEEEKFLDSKIVIAPKVSLGTNTDLNFDSDKKTEQSSNEMFRSKNYKTNFENCEDQKIYEKKGNSGEKLKINSKEMIINEIRIMQRKLNALIKSIESNDFVFNGKENEMTESDSKIFDEGSDNLERMSEPLLNETFQKKYQKFDERPIFLPFEYPSFTEKSRTKTKKQNQNINQSRKNETLVAPEKSASNNFLPNCLSSATMMAADDQKSKDNVKEFASSRQIDCRELENRKIVGLSKSDSSIRVIIADTKYSLINGLKKSLSLDLKDGRMEVLKKIKNFSSKLEGNLKTKTSVRIHQNQEGFLGDNLPLLKCEIGDDINKKPINNNNDFLNVNQAGGKSGNSFLEDITPDVKKKFSDEGDAKIVCPKETLVTPNTEKLQPDYCNPDIISSENVLKPKKSLSFCTVKSKTIVRSSEIGTKINIDVEKPITPNKSCRKISTADTNAKKDPKINKKINKAKVGEKTRLEGKDMFQQEIEKKRTLSGNRKSARNNGDSKLHIDKLIKLDILNNPRALSSVKSNHDEKAGGKSDRVSRPLSQKRRRSEHPIDVLFEEKVGGECEITERKSNTLMQVDSCPTDSIPGSKVKKKDESVQPESKRKNPREISLNLTSENSAPLSSNSSSIVVELFSKKPKTVDEFYYEAHQENLNKPLNLEKVPIKKNEAEKEANENTENLEKPIVKSVWALTKVLLYEDGTRKLEILEASLTPPGYFLNQQKCENELNKNLMKY